MNENKTDLQRVIAKIKNDSPAWPSDEVDFIEKILKDLNVSIETEDD